MGMSPSTSRGAPGKGAPMTARSMQYQPANMAGTSQYGNMAGFSGGIGAFRQPFTRDLPSGYDPNVHQPSIGFMPGFESASGPSTIPAGMQGDQLREQQAATSAQPNMSIDGAIPRSAFGDLAFGPAVFPGATVTRDDGQGQPGIIPRSAFGDLAFGPVVFPGVTTAQALEARQPQPLRQIGDMSFAQPAVMPDDFLAARQAGLQVGPTPNQPQNPYAGMSTGALQQMNEQIRMQQMQADAAARNQVPWYMRPPGMNERPGPVSSPSQPYQRQSPFGMPMQYRPPMQQPYQQPYYQQRMQPNMFGGLAALMPFLRRQY